MLKTARAVNCVINTICADYITSDTGNAPYTQVTPDSPGVSFGYRGAPHLAGNALPPHHRGRQWASRAPQQHGVLWLAKLWPEQQ